MVRTSEAVRMVLLEPLGSRPVNDGSHHIHPYEKVIIHGLRVMDHLIALYSVILVIIS